MDLTRVSEPADLDEDFVNRPNKHKDQSNNEDLDSKFDRRPRHGRNG